MDSDGPNKIELLLLEGQSSRMWFEARYLEMSRRPLGKISRVVPTGSNDPHRLLDALLALAPDFFRKCPSFAAVEAECSTLEFLDLDAGPIPSHWAQLREEARAIFDTLPLWSAAFEQVN